MKKIFFTAALSLLILSSCNKDKDILNSLNDYNLTQMDKGYKFGDKLELPKDVLDYAESITIGYGDKETNNLVVSPDFFSLGDNDVTFYIKTKSGDVLQQDATINVFAKNPAKNLSYDIITEYPHDPNNFVQGFQLEGNTIYESDGQTGQSNIKKYILGTTEPLVKTPQPADVFSEGCTIVGDKIYQLTWKNKKGYIYNKSDLKLISEFDYPNTIGEGWGLTYDGKHLLLSDGTKNIYFLDPNDLSKVIKTISVASDKEGFDQLNELEYYNGFIYANVWQKPIILQINPSNGEVAGIIDLTDIANKHVKGSDDVLNGITFRGNNMLITGKNWDKIYEIKLK